MSREIPPALVSIPTGNGPLSGFWYDSDRANSRGTCVVVPGAGGYSVGPHRLLCDASRRICRSGFDVLRFDYRGRGDSAGDSDLVDGESMLADIQAAIQFAEHRAPEQSILYFGLCFGATAAFERLLHRPSTGGAILLSPEPPTDATSASTVVRSGLFKVRWRLHRLGDPSNWTRWITHPGILFRKASGLLRQLRRAVRSKSQGAVRRAIQAPVLIVYGTADENCETIEAYYPLSAGDRPSQMQLVKLETDHNFTTHASSSQMFRAVDQWIDRVFERPEPVARRV